jgi:hypothetical protein
MPRTRTHLRGGNHEALLERELLRHPAVEERISGSLRIVSARKSTDEREERQGR